MDREVKEALQDYSNVYFKKAKSKAAYVSQQVNHTEDNPYSRKINRLLKEGRLTYTDLDTNYELNELFDTAYSDVSDDLLENDYLSTLNFADLIQDKLYNIANKYNLSEVENAKLVDTIDELKLDIKQLKEEKQALIDELIERLPRNERY